MEILDISKIVITGRIVRFGEDYLKCVREEVMKSQNICEVEFSHLNGKSIFIGAISVAVDHLIESLLNEKVRV